MFKDQKLSYAVTSGQRYGCPLCIALTSPKPNVGDRVVLLGGSRSGMIGTVSKTVLDSKLREGTFLIHADTDRPSVEQIVEPSLHLFAVYNGAFDLPDWFPPFTDKECVDLHSVIVASVDEGASATGWAWDRKHLSEVIRYSWAKRLPIEPAEVWLLLSAHGVPSQYEEEASRLFVEGTELLQYAVGKRPVKKKRLSGIRQRDT